MRVMGKPIAEAIGKVEFCKSVYAFYATMPERSRADEPITLIGGQGSAFVRKRYLAVGQPKTSWR